MDGHYFEARRDQFTRQSYSKNVQVISIKSDFKIKPKKGMAAVLVILSTVFLLYVLITIGGREEALQDSSLRGPEWLAPRVVPYFLPFTIYISLLTVYDVLFPRSLRVTPEGVRSLFWSLSWSEIRGVRLLHEERKNGRYPGDPQVVLDVIPEAHARNKWKNLRDSPRIWALCIPIIPPPKYEIRCRNVLQIPGPEIARYLRECHEYYYLRHTNNPEQSCPRRGTSTE